MSGPYRAALAGALAVLLVLAILAAGAVLGGAYDVAADAPHTAPVRAFLALVRARSIAFRARDIAVPALSDPKQIADGASDYDAMCTLCHLAPGLDPKPPLFSKFAHLTSAEQFWTIKHGIKMTGMSAWGLTHSDAEIWNMVAFLQVLPKPSPAGYKAFIQADAGHHEHDQGMKSMDMGH